MFDWLGNRDFPLRFSWPFYDITGGWTNLRCYFCLQSNVGALSVIIAFESGSTQQTGAG